MTAPWPASAHRGPKSLSPLCHQENGNILFRFQCLVCWQSPNSAAQSLVKFSHESWSGSTLGPATLSGARVRDQPVPAHHRELLPTHNVAVTFQRGGDAVKGNTDHCNHHRPLWWTLRYIWPGPQPQKENCWYRPKPTTPEPLITLPAGSGKCELPSAARVCQLQTVTQFAFLNTDQNHECLLFF